MISLRTGFVPPDLKAAIAEARRRQVVEKGAFDVMDFENKAKSFTVAGDLSNRLISDIQSKVNSAIANGTSYRDFVKSMDPATVEKIAAPQVVYDNAVNNAYQKGRFDSQQRLKSIKPLLEYITMRDDKVRPNHAILHGIIAPIDSSFWAANYPPNGHRCRCIAQSRTIRDAEKAGKNIEGDIDRVYDRLLQDQSKKGVPMKKVVRPGPDKGWKGAFKPGSNTVDSYVNDFKNIPDKFSIPIYTPKIPGVRQVSDVGFFEPEKIISISQFKNINQAKKAIKKIPEPGFVPAVDKADAKKRLSQMTTTGEKGMLSGVKIAESTSMKSLNVVIKESERIYKKYGFKYGTIDLTLNRGQFAARVGAIGTDRVATQYFQIKKSTLTKREAKVYGKFDFNVNKSESLTNEARNLLGDVSNSVSREQRTDLFKSYYEKNPLEIKLNIQSWYESLPEMTRLTIKPIFDRRYSNIIKIYNCERFSVSSSAIFEGKRLRGTISHEAGHGFENSYSMKAGKKYGYASDEFERRLKAAGIEEIDYYEISDYAYNGKDRKAECFAECFAIIDKGAIAKVTGEKAQKILKIAEDVIGEMMKGTL